MSPTSGDAERAAGGPAVVRRLTTPPALALADLAATFDDLQSVLRCCERLVSELGSEQDQPDDLALEAFWTTAVLSYARCFSTETRPTGLTTEDVTATGLAGEVLDWHRVLLQLRDHYADLAVNPREAFSVGASQDAAGAADGIAVTSTRAPSVDEVTVRQAGAIAYALSGVVDRRIAEQQQEVFATLTSLSKADLDQLQLLEVVAPGRVDEG
ncbi:MAG: hypothetical protein M3419_02780 [Actinomycetota bacterium]|nr:hypothetical protein [Actinomycetota bacterium]